MKYFFVLSFFIQRIHAVSKIDLLSAYCNTYNNRSIYYKSPLQYAFSYFGSVLHKSPPQSDISFSSVKLWRKCSEKQVYISTSKIWEFSIFGLFFPPVKLKKFLWSISNIRTVIRIYLLQCVSYFFRQNLRGPDKWNHSGWWEALACDIAVLELDAVIRAIQNSVPHDNRATVA